ncbi:SDR family NAD(P)-dependent oxidoreductase [Chelatococcus reniformis]|uniref:Short-chain dehydrogenase n=1 Tax=Chelatococcus reniformis TaxID=1494448 RepID=A0A916UTY2_9HYPH|nr:SDR family NAD(P)-dependent oxidoreductase [Chelatococcus reniformis]GGC86696.1 short-chain dehydrogenase [Chelatococcus reniformis]
MTRPVALITGVGPGTGRALARRFAEGGYEVAMLARTAERLHEIEQAHANCHAFVTDVTDAAALERGLTAVESRLGPPSVVVHNAVGGAFGSFLDIDPAVLARNFDVNVMALLHLARRVAPGMVAAGKGAIIATGNTSALRGRANFAGFAPTKAAQRILAEAMARELGPKGVHVAYVIVDAVIDLPWTRARYREAADDFFIKPEHIADEIWHLAQRPRSAWSFNVELRPFRETW